MKKTVSILLASCLALLVVGCAGSPHKEMGMKGDMETKESMKMEKSMKVKCPECGFEFYPKEYGG